MVTPAPAPRVGEPAFKSVSKLVAARSGMNKSPRVTPGGSCSLYGNLVRDEFLGAAAQGRSANAWSQGMVSPAMLDTERALSGCPLRHAHPDIEAPGDSA